MGWPYCQAPTSLANALSLRASLGAQPAIMSRGVPSSLFLSSFFLPLPIPLLQSSIPFHHSTVASSLTDKSSIGYQNPITHFIDLIDLVCLVDQQLSSLPLPRFIKVVMATPTLWSCRFHSAASPGVAIVGCRCPLDMDSRFHGRGTFGPPLSATLVGGTVPDLASSAKGEAYQLLPGNIDRDFDGLTITTRSTLKERRCDDLAASHIGTPTGGGWMVPFQHTPLGNGESSNQRFSLSRPKVHPNVGLQEQRRRALYEQDERQRFRQDFVLFPEKQVTRGDAATHPPLPKDSIDLALQPPAESGADWFPLQPNRRQPPATPRITRLQDLDLDDVDESDFFPSLDELDRKRQNLQADESCNSRYSVPHN